jgi:transposase
MAVVTKQSRPLALQVFSATPFETTLVEQTIKKRFAKAKIKTLVGDRAYDSDPLDQKLRAKGIELIAPHKRNRRKAKTQDGRKLRHYRHRWTIARFFSYLQNFRKCVTRYERYSQNFKSFIYLAAVIMYLRYFLDKL